MFKAIKERFAVIGKEGSTSDGEGFIQKLWDDANGQFTTIPIRQRERVICIFR